MVLGVVIGLLAVVGFLVTRDNGHFQPETAEMEALAGRPLEEPTYASSSLLTRWTAKARAWWTYWTAPLPNQMAMYTRGDVWMYGFAAPEAYRPPETSGLACHGGGEFPLVCESTEPTGRWVYTIEFDAATGRGTLTAQLLPRPKASGAGA